MDAFTNKCKFLSPCTLWITGLSGAGKTTISTELKSCLNKMLNSEAHTMILDGDIIRSGLNCDLGYTKLDVIENNRRVSEVAKLFNISGKICICASVSPYACRRSLNRKTHEDSGLKYLECFLSTPIEICESRDVKGLYK